MGICVYGDIGIRGYEYMVAVGPTKTHALYYVIYVYIGGLQK